MFTIIGETLVKYNGYNKIVEIPSIVRTIDERAFENNSHIEEVYGLSVEEVLKNAFKNCSNLKKVVFPNLQYLEGLTSTSLNKIEISKDSDIYSTKFKPDTIKVGQSTYKSSLEVLYEARRLLKDFSVRTSNRNPNIAFKSKDINSFKLCGNATMLLDGIVRMENYFDMLPSSFKEVILDSGYKIYLIDSEFKLNGEVISGFASKSDRVIMLDQFNIDRTMLHELGHSIDYIYDLSKRTYFNKLFYMESCNLHRSMDISSSTLKHLKSSPREYFAESFQSSILFEDSFSKECPKTYEYFSILFEENGIEKIKAKTRV